MKKMSRGMMISFLLFSLLCLSCNQPGLTHLSGRNNPSPTRWTLEYENGFLLMNAPVETNRLYLVIEESIAGNFEYIANDEDLGIVNSSDFSQSSLAPQSISLQSNRGIWDSSIVVINSAGIRLWAFAGREYHLWIHNTQSGEITHLQCTVPENQGATINTGILYNSAGTDSLDYHVSLPAEYTAEELWPLILTVQAPDFVEKNHHFPAVCVYIPTGHTSREILAQVPGLVAETVAQYSIDPDRIFAWGYSAGGCSSMKYVNDDGQESFDFIAMVGIGISDFLVHYDDNMGDVDAWLLYGENDTSCGPDTIEVYNDLPQGSGEHLLTMIPDTEHGNSNNPPWQNPFIFNWLFDR